MNSQPSNWALFEYLREVRDPDYGKKCSAKADRKPAPSSAPAKKSDPANVADRPTAVKDDQSILQSGKTNEEPLPVRGGGPISSEKSRLGVQKRMRVVNFVWANQKLFANQGSVVATTRTVGGVKYGPYYKLIYREDKKKRSMYIGMDRRLANGVRDSLKGVQAVREANRINRQFDKDLREVWKKTRFQLDFILVPLGLRRKGTQFRGWRTCVPVKQLRMLNGSRIYVPGLPRLPRFSLPKIPPLNDYLDPEEREILFGKPQEMTLSGRIPRAALW